ncbi:NAD(P)H-dependent oxidoreductase [Pseudomaricurvus alcaniphilus]|uniref:NADPH-dependent FMN reductase n=1 Tax=Pseudomaricurvus alcaniphilus TaxID=1166482 RepID=UPI001408CAED|nr:NAD(P)H-dependent oxidoreductase [Pseudomaricurvus alcaniphilus]NHN36181.1 NAD(P)H-dependent oxidoreductase [Pseudomaricurvus alcaniphilus]
MKILAFAASNSRKSINKDLIRYASTLLPDSDVDIIDINDYEMPIYNADLEEAHGIPESASRFLDKIAAVDALLISYAEHNGNYTVAYKNLFDWASRKNREVYQGKPIVMLSTSPGAGGARSVLSLAVESAHFFAGKVMASLSVPEFFKNFDQDKGVLTNQDMVRELEETLSTLQEV